MTNQYLSPLEYLLQSICGDAANFPTNANYYQRYCQIVDQLKDEVYKRVNEGLAALSEESGLYTDHSEDHFDKVVLHAGLLLGLDRRADVDSICQKVMSNQWILTPYEIYILLLSIRLHDVGNIYGREHHEQEINKVIQNFSLVFLHKDKIESTMIASIAGAHGGTTRDGDKDTIGRLQDSNSSNAHIHGIDCKKIAAITRFADEVCENRQRVASSSAMDIPIHNLVFHKYAEAIAVNSVKDRMLHLSFQFHLGDLSAKYQVYEKKGKKKKLVDVYLPVILLERLRKTELERRYCNRFIPDLAQIRGISVHINIIEDEKDEESFKHEVLDQITFTLKEEGYPSKEGLMFDDKTKAFLNYERLCQVRTDGECINEKYR